MAPRTPLPRPLPRPLPHPLPRPLPHPRPHLVVIDEFVALPNGALGKDDDLLQPLIHGHHLTVRVRVAAVVNKPCDAPDLRRVHHVVRVHAEQVAPTVFVVEAVARLAHVGDLAAHDLGRREGEKKRGEEKTFNGEKCLHCR